MRKQRKHGSIIHLLSRFRKVMIRPSERGPRDSLLYWQQTIFITLLLIILVLGPFATVSGSLEFYREGRIFLSIITFLLYFLYASLAFMRFISYYARLVILGISLYVVGIMLLITTGPYGAGLLYLCASYVYLSLNVSKESNIRHIAFNALIMLVLSILYLYGALDGLPIIEYGTTWWVIVVNVVLINILITQMISIILLGLERRYCNENRSNRELRRIREENSKQIRLLKSLRQIGNCISETRLDFSERLNMMQKNLHSELPVSASAISLLERNTDYSVYLTAVPEEMEGSPFQIPQFPGPFLMMNKYQLMNIGNQTAMMNRLDDEGVYFGSHFYTKSRKGFLELLLNREPDPIELEYLQMNLFQLSSAITNEELIHQLEDSRDLLENSYDEILKAWAGILELRDIETKGHCNRVVNIAMTLADLLNLPEEDRIYLKRGALLHDIGKLGIPDSILHKNASLSPIEWDIMRKHPQMGKEAVRNIPFLQPSIPVIYNHHERWDGTGYPEGLLREEIPLCARIFTLVDVYDALISERPYRKALQEIDVLSYMKSQSGQIFDPELLEIFLKNAGMIAEKSRNKSSVK